MSTRAMYVMNNTLSALHSQEKSVFASSSSSINRLKPEMLDMNMSVSSTER